MFNWAGLQVTLQHVFESATQIPFIWQDETRKVLTKPFGILSLGQSIMVGQDYGQYTFRDGGGTCELIGHRELTINVQIFSRTAQGQCSSRVLIERARLSLANPSYQKELNAAGLVFVENHPVNHLEFSFQNRAENRSTFDVVFRLVLKDKIPSKIPYFDSVKVENAL